MNNYTQQGTNGMVQLWAEMFGWWLDMMGPWVPPALRETVRMYGNRPSGPTAGGSPFSPGYPFPFPTGFPFPFPTGFPFPFPFPQQNASYPAHSPYPPSSPYPSSNPSSAPYPSTPSYPQSTIPSAIHTQASSLGVTLALVTTRPVEVHIELSSNADLSQVSVQELAGLTGAGRISNVRLESGSEGFPLLRLSVTAELPTGTYTGLILDRRTSETYGLVRVAVRA